ncbi:MAG: beta strand repeat-containing protein [Candidatus Melainabacteria bacterium]
MKKPFTAALACSIAMAYTGVPAFALTINPGDTMTVESINGAAYTYSEAGDIIINGTLQGFDRVAPSGAATGNGANITLTSTGGSIIVGPSGRIIINGTVVGGNGGTLILNASTITINGIISANGLGTGGIGGNIEFNGTTLNLGNAASISAIAGSVNDQGGSVTINCSGLVTINAGAGISTKGASDATHNLISVTGSGVNLGGQLNAQSRGTDNGGTVEITAATGAITITNSGSIIAAGYINNDGGTITLTGSVDNQGILNAAAGTGNATGGTIAITGGSTKSFSQSGSGRLYAQGQSSAAASNGGSITINTGTVTVNNSASGATMDVSGSKLDTATGSGGSVDIRATNGDLQLTDVDIRNYGDGGSIYLRSNTGDVNIGTGSFVYGYGDATNRIDLISSTGDVNVDALVGMDGIGNGNGGIVNVSAAGDLNVTTNGYLSARGSFTQVGSGTDGGNITVNANNINLTGNAKMRTYGTQYQGVGNIGYGGVIDLNATNNYYSESGVILNAGGARAYTGPTITKNVIDIAASNMTVDGRYLSHGRNNAEDGGRITFTAANNLTLAGTSSLEAWGDLWYGGNGGEIHLSSTSGDINIQNGAMLSVAGISGSLGGLMNIDAGNDITLDAITLDASGLDGGSIIVDASNALSYTGTTFMANGVTGLGGLIDLTAGGVMTVDNSASYDASGTGNGILSFTGTSVNNGGNITVTNGEVQMTATTGNVTNTGNLTSNSVQFTAANGNVSSSGIHSGEVNATGQTVAVTNASGTFTVGDVSATAGNATLTSTTGNMNIASTSAVSATNTLTANATSGNITTNGALTGTSGGIHLNANNGTITGTQGSYSGTLNASANSMSLAASSGSIRLGDLTTDSSTMYVSANNGGLTFTGGNTLSSAGLMTLRAGTGSISADATTNFAATGLLVSVANDLTLTGNNSSLNVASIDVYGDAGTSDAAGNINITKTSGNLLISRLTSNGNNTIAATSGTSTLTVANATTAGGTTTLQAGNTITATSNNNWGGAVEAYGNTGTADYVGTANITSTNTTTGLNMTRLTATNATLTATTGSGAMSVSNLETNNGTIVMTASQGMTLSNSTINNTDTVRMTTNNNGTVSLANNSIDDIQGRTSMASPTNGLYVDTAGSYALAGNTITGGFDVATNGSISMTSGSIVGTTTASATNINMTADSGNLSLGAMTASSGGVTVNASAGGLTTNGNISSTGSTTLTGGNGSVTVNNAISANGDISITASGSGSDISLNNSLTARNTSGVGQDITLNANDAITLASAGDIYANGSGTGDLGGNISITAGGNFSATSSGTYLYSYGETDATHNSISVTAGDIDFNGRMWAHRDDGDSKGDGGRISLTSTTGDILLDRNASLYAYGEARSNGAVSAQGGQVTISAARDYTQDGATIYADSYSTRKVSSGLNDGGTVSISAGRNANLTYRGTTLIWTDGGSITRGAGDDGGNGGDVTITAGNQLNFIRGSGSGQVKYITAVGGRGRGGGNSGGNGGTVYLNYGSLSVDGFSAGTPYNSFDYRLGRGSSGASSGSNGNIYLNGVLTY